METKRSTALQRKAWRLSGSASQILIVSDLHGSLEAEEALPKDFDRFRILGDLVNYGPNPEREDLCPERPPILHPERLFLEASGTVFRRTKNIKRTLHA